MNTQYSSTCQTCAINAKYTHEITSMRTDCKQQQQQSTMRLCLIISPNKLPLSLILNPRISYARHVIVKRPNNKVDSRWLTVLDWFNVFRHRSPAGVLDLHARFLRSPGSTAEHVLSSSNKSWHVRIVYTFTSTHSYLLLCVWWQHLGAILLAHFNDIKLYY